MDETRGNSLTVGGVLLQRASGGYTITNPVAQYGHVSDEHVQEFWHWIAKNEKVQKAMAEFNNAVSGELIAWGDARNLKPNVKDDYR